MPKRKPRKPKGKKRKRTFIRVEIVPLDKVLPVVKEITIHKVKKRPAKKRKPRLDVNQMASALVRRTIEQSET